ncbi:hypothetical protein Hanom_Chr02g00158211 [Helianthus anomalus]
MNDDPIMLAYQMIGSDKLFSDIEFLIQNVIVKKIEKVFKLVDIEKSEIVKLVGKAGNLKGKKSFYNNPGNSCYKKKIIKAGLGYKKKSDQKKSFEKLHFQKKINFVHGISSEKRERTPI